MENPATWDEVTKLINNVIVENAKSLEEGFCGSSLALQIRNELDRKGYLVIPDSTPWECGPVHQ